METKPESPQEETPPESATAEAGKEEEKKPREWYNVFGVAYDFYHELWNKVWREKRDELKQEVEARRGLILKDGLEFHEMQFKSQDPKAQKAELEAFTEKLSPAHAPKLKTAAEMMAELPEKKYPKEEIKLLGRFAEAISSIESGGRHGVLGPEIKGKKSSHFGDRALGRYQVMPNRWLEWSGKIFDGKMVEPTPQAQEYVAYKMFMEYYDHLKKKYPENPHRLYTALASQWVGGGFTTKFFGETIPLGGKDTQQYSQKAIKKMGLEPPLEEKVISKAAEYTHEGKKAYKWVKSLWK